MRLLFDVIVDLRRHGGAEGGRAWYLVPAAADRGAGSSAKGSSENTSGSGKTLEKAPWMGLGRSQPVGCAQIKTCSVSEAKTWHVVLKRGGL